MRYAFVKKIRVDYPVRIICRVLKVSASGFYEWLKRSLSKRKSEDTRLKLVISAIHKQTRGTYGVRRMRPELKEAGWDVGRDRITRLRRELGIFCKQKRKFKATTDSRHHLPVADNLLNQSFKVKKPNQVYSGDITYISTAEGWLYLAALKDLYHGEIVGYALGERMTTDLISKALFRSIQNKRPAQGLIHHSDRGSQYCSNKYQKLLKQFGIVSSMSRKGNCYDNAPIESFWGSLKNEQVHHKKYQTRDEAMASIREYIEVFYNRQRRQARLGYLSPVRYVQQYYQKMGVV